MDTSSSPSGVGAPYPRGAPPRRNSAGS
jgi:hypothetical protein